MIIEAARSNLCRCNLPHPNRGTSVPPAKFRSTLDEWVYNAADIDHAKVIWAREMGSASDLELIHYYSDRTVWLVQPDLPGAELAPYPLEQQETAALRPSSPKRAH